MTEYTYDPAGNLLRAQAGDGKEVMTAVSYEYDALNRVTAVISPVGGRTVYTYDKKTGKISSITDAAGNQRTFRYNILGELTEETDIHGNTTRYEYNALGRPATITDGAGRTTRHTYLPGGRLEKTEYSDGTYISYEYDSIGRLKKKTDQSGRSITYTYDCMGRILTVSGSAGQEKSYTYDAIGNVTSATDADGNVTKYAYTLNGRLKEVTDALGNKTEYAYDKADRLIYICQHGQAGEADRTTAYERDAFGQVVCIRDASGGEEHFCYDALGRMIEKTDREGLVTAYTYTPDGRPESILYGDGRSAQMEYTPLRQLAAVKDWLGETRIERSRQGNPVSITDHNGRTVRYEWGSMGQREGMIYPDGTKISWKYDSLLRPVQMNRTAAGRDPLWTQYQYDGQGRLSEKRTSGGYITRWQYDETGLLGELSHTDASGILDRFQYTYDAAGNKTAIRKERRGFPEESGSYQYAYDGLHRLTGVEKDGKPLRSYQYDTFGNRTVMEDCTRGIMTVSEYDALNHLIRQEISKDAFPEDTIQKTYTYDKRGNLTGEYQDGDLLHGYAFNSMNRLEKAWDSEGTEAEYFYNALGQRTARSTAGETEEYLLDLTKPYHNLLELQKGKHRQTFYWDMNVSAMEDENRTLQYYLQDELGSPLRVLYRSGSGAAYGYDEFGADLYDPEKKPGAGRQYSRQGEHQPFGFTGYRYDDISGTYFAQAREYQPGVGRFTAEDVVRGNGADPKVFNHYEYCFNNPILLVDLNGLKPRPAWLDGIYAHIQFETLFLLLYSELYVERRKKDNIYGKANVYIPGGGKTGGRGFADVVLYTKDNAQIYEIKPQSYYNDLKKKQDGEDQLKRYIDTYNNNGNNPGAIKGLPENVDTIIYKKMNYWFSKNKSIIYRMYDDSPGMIYYEFIEENGQPSTVTTYELDEDTEKLLTIMLISPLVGAEAIAGVGEAVMNGLFFLLIPQYELDTIKQRYTDGCEVNA